MIELQGIDKLVLRFEQMKTDLPEKVNEIMNRLANIGVSVARVNFANAIYDGTNDVTVDDPVWVSEKTIEIVARGRAVAFIEFGAGVHYSSERHPKEAEFGFNRGSFGWGHGNQDMWYYQGEKGTNGVELSGKWEGWVSTQGNPANRCLYDTAKEMRERINEIVKEVMGA